MEHLEIYIDRLLQEWKQHGKIVIGVDYDDTIFNWKMQTHATYERVIDLLKAARYTGAYIVIFSACAPDRHDEIKTYCKSKGIEVDEINKNPVELPYGKHGKIFANIFLDDRAGLFESLYILETAMYRYRGYKEAERVKQLNEVG